MHRKEGKRCTSQSPQNDIPLSLSFAPFLFHEHVRGQIYGRRWSVVAGGKRRAFEYLECEWMRMQVKVAPGKVHSELTGLHRPQGARALPFFTPLPPIYVYNIYTHTYIMQPAPTSYIARCSGLVMQMRKLQLCLRAHSTMLCGNASGATRASSYMRRPVYASLEC